MVFNIRQKQAGGWVASFAGMAWAGDTRYLNTSGLVPKPWLPSIDDVDVLLKVLNLNSPATPGKDPGELYVSPWTQRLA